MMAPSTAWWFLHNLVFHPLIALFGWRAGRLHDITAEKAGFPDS